MTFECHNKIHLELMHSVTVQFINSRGIFIKSVHFNLLHTDMSVCLLTILF